MKWRPAAAAAAAGVAAASILNTHPGLVDRARGRLGDVPILGGFSSAGSANRATGRCSAGDGIPVGYCRLYKQAADDAPCDVSWRVLAAIGYIESRHGANTGPSSAGALGPMQFMPATWRAYGRDGDGDGRKNIHDPADAIAAAAGYLCANHADRNLRGAIWHYNHSTKYVNDVLAEADQL
jgi:membrane-bound lytic murein transglycosylase B